VRRVKRHFCRHAIALRQKPRLNHLEDLLFEHLECLFRGDHWVSVRFFSLRMIETVDMARILRVAQFIKTPPDSPRACLTVVVVINEAAALNLVPASDVAENPELDDAECETQLALFLLTTNLNGASDRCERNSVLPARELPFPNELVAPDLELCLEEVVALTYVDEGHGCEILKLEP
jgi:hypothetical protein